jgi:hypothetical protein
MAKNLQELVYVQQQADACTPDIQEISGLVFKIENICSQANIELEAAVQKIKNTP